MSINLILGSVSFEATVKPAWVSVNTTDDLATCMATGYLNGTGETWGIDWTKLPLVLINPSDTTPVWLAVQIDAESNINLVSLSPT
jgi:hypothetical protein